MPSAPYTYCLLIGVDPARGKPYLDWLVDGHIKEVFKTPGFLSAKLINLAEDAPDGWQRYMVVYEVKDRATLEHYWQSDAFRGYGEKAQEFKSRFRITRVSGETILSYP